MNNKKGFTLIEILVVVAITSMLAGSVIVTINPGKRFEQAQDMQRQVHLQSILSAIEMRKTVERGWPGPCEDFPQELSTSSQPIFKTIGNKVDPGFYDLYKCLVPTYLSSELFDPEEGSKEDTKYQIWQNPYSKVITLTYVKDEKKIALGPEEYQVLNVPTVTTANVFNISYTSAESGGEVTADGDSAVFERGVVWNTATSATIYDNRTVNGSGLGVFSSKATKLGTDVTYYLRAYARNDVGVGYGEGKKFRTCSLESTAVETLDATNVTNNRATIQGEITCVGTSIPRRYFDWGQTQNYEKPDINIEIGGLGVFSTDITSGLLVDTTYYYRACAENNIDTYCGEQKTFFTAMQKPEVTTADIINIDYSFADSGGSIISDGGGSVTKKGVCWSDFIKDPTTGEYCTDNGTGNDSFVSNMTNLNPGTKYYVRAYATNVVDTGYGQRKEFITLGGLCQGIESGGAPRVPGTALSCSTKLGNCSDGETTILKISDTDNAHAEVASRQLYGYSVCCSGNMLGSACDGNFDTFVKLSGNTNAHVEKKNQLNYPTSACLSTTYGADKAFPSTIKCDYVAAPAECSSLGPLYACLVSISGYTNAHIGDCDAYPTKVCCANVCP